MKNFNIVKNKGIFFIITAVVFVAGFVSLFTLGLNWDIEFVGGTELSYNIGKNVEKSDEKVIEDLVVGIIGEKDFSSIRVGGDQNDTVIVRTMLVAESAGETEGAEGEGKINEYRQQITDAILEVYPDAKWESTNTVSGEVSSNLKKSAVVATVTAVALMLVYIAFRFEISSAFAAILCLIHDVCIVIFSYSVFQIPVGSTIIAVVLTILGYSINATIVIFDRVRENVKQMPQSVSFEDKIDSAIKSTIWRSLNTTITTLITIGAIYILGVTSIKNFALPIIVGVIAGGYSSISLAGSFWSMFKKKSSRIK